MNVKATELNRRGQSSRRQSQGQATSVIRTNCNVIKKHTDHPPTHRSHNRIGFAWDIRSQKCGSHWFQPGSNQSSHTRMEPWSSQSQSHPSHTGTGVQNPDSTESIQMSPNSASISHTGTGCIGSNQIQSGSATLRPERAGMDALPTPTDKS